MDIDQTSKVDDDDSLVFQIPIDHPAAQWAYYFPRLGEEHKDDVEAQELLHMVYELVWDKNFIQSPAKEMLKNKSGAVVYDIGTGSGIWAIDVADAFDESTVVGFDCTAVQDNWVPPNTMWFIEDVEDEDFYKVDPADQPADFCALERPTLVHARDMVLAIRDWPGFLQRTYDALKPGGWIEIPFIDYHPRSRLHDDDVLSSTLGEEPGLISLWNHINKGLEALGVDHTLSAKGRMASLVREAGFQSVTEESRRLPVGQWDTTSTSCSEKNKRLRMAGGGMKEMLYDNTDFMANLMAVPLMCGLGWPQQQAVEFTVACKRAITSKSCKKQQPFFDMRVVYAQKPEVKKPEVAAKL